MRIFANLLFILLATAVWGQDTIYVSTTGNNGNAGTQSAPFRTIQHAVWNAPAGTTILITAGKYRENVFINTTTGTSAKPIVISNYQNDLVVMDGRGDSANIGDALMSISDVSYITINGIHFQNMQNNYVKGLIIGKNCNHITVSNCKFSEIHFSSNPNDPVSSNLNVNPLICYSTDAANPCTDINFLSNEVFHCRTGFSEGMTINGNVDGFLIEGNYVHDITNIGIVAAGHYQVCPDTALDQSRNGVIRNNEVHDCASPIAIAGGIYVDGGKNIMIENNRCYSGQVGISIGCENIGKSTSGITVRNNVVHHNMHTGIVIGGYSYPTGSGKVTRCYISGNTCFNNDRGGNWVGELWMTYCEQISVTSNIFYAGNANKVLIYYKDQNGSGNQLDYNLYFYSTGMNNCLFTYDGNGYSTFDAYKTASGWDDHSIFADPVFMDTAKMDFHLLEGSPAINAGDPSYLSLGSDRDMDMESRVRDTIDMGADETYFQKIGIAQLSLDAVKVFPNPAALTLSIQGDADWIGYSIISITGEQIQSGLNEFGSIDISTLPSGCYLLELETEGSVQIVRFVKL